MSNTNSVSGINFNNASNSNTVNLEEETNNEINNNSNESNVINNNSIKNSVNNQVNKIVNSNVNKQNPTIEKNEIVKINDISNDISTNKNDSSVNAKIVEPFDDETTKLFDSYENLCNKYKNTTSLEEKLRCMDSIDSIINIINNKLENANFSDEKNQILMALFDKVSDDMLQIADESKKLKSFTDELKNINNNSTLTNNEKLAIFQDAYDKVRKETYPYQSDYEARIQMLRESAGAFVEDNIDNDKFFKDLQISKNDKDNVINAAKKILSNLLLNLSSSETRELDYNITSLFKMYQKCHGDNIKNKTINEQMSDFIKLMDNLSKAQTAKDICSRTDALLNNYSGDLARDIKESLTNPTDYGYVEVQHTYQSALHNLIKALPKDVENQFKNATYIDQKLLKAITQNTKAFDDIKFQLASMLMMQYNLISKNAIEIIGDNGKPLNTYDALALCYEVADSSEISREISELTNAAEQGKFQSISLDQTAEIVINAVKQLADKYDIGHMSGVNQEKAHINVVKNTADKLTNGVFSNKDMKQVFDTNHNIKCLRVFDNVLKQLSGELNVEKRGVLAGDSTKDQLESTDSDLFKNIQKGIRNALIVHSRFLDKADKESLKLMNSLLVNSKNKDLNDLKNNFMTVIHNKIVTDKLTYNDIDIKLKGLRKEFSNCYNKITKFAEANNECIRLHDQKKQLNKEYKAQESIYNQLTWVWPTQKKARIQNVNTIIEMTKNRERIDTINSIINDANSKGTILTNIKDLENEKTYLLEEQLEKFNLVKNINLSNLVTIDKNAAKKEQSIDEFLEKAAPIAKAFNFFSSGVAKVVKEEINELKKQRNELRNNLNDYLNLGKKAFGQGTVEQLQRAITTAVYIASKDNESEQANAYDKNSREKIENILKNNIGLDSDNEFINVLIDDTIRRFTDPKGNITPKYISIIEKRLCKESQIVTDKEYFMDQKTLNTLESNAMKAYKQKGTDGLLNFVKGKGQSFTYSRHAGIKLSSTPIVALTLGGKKDDAIAVTNIGDKGYEVTLKSEKCAEIAAKLALIKVINVTEVYAQAKFGFKNINGLKLNFKTKEDLNEFLKDFMDNSSKLHTKEDYNPNWLKLCEFSTIEGKNFEGGISTSAKIGLGIIKKIKDRENDNARLKLRLPEVNASVGGQIQYNTVTTKKGDVSTKSSKFQAQLNVEGSVKPLSVNVRVKEYSNFKYDLAGNVALDLVSKYSNQLIPFIEPLLGTLNETAKSKAGQKFFKTFKENVTRNLKNSPDLSLKQTLLEAATDAFNVHKDILLKEVLKDFVHQESDDKLVNATQFTLGAYLAYITTRDGYNLAKEMGLDTDKYIFKAKLNIDDVTSSTVRLIKDYMLSDVKDPNEEISTLQKIFSGIKKTAKVVGTGLQAIATIDQVLDGDPVAVLSKISSYFDKKENVHQSKYGTVKTTVGGDKIVDISAAERSTHTSVNASANLVDGVNFKATFGTILETEFKDSFNDVKKIHTEDTGIKQTLAISQFSLENAFQTFKLPVSFWEKYQSNTEFQNNLKDVLKKSSPTDTISINFKINKDKLNEINSLEKQKELAKDNDELKAIENKISDILGDRDNYDATNLEINIAKNKNMFTALDIFGNLDLGMVAFEYNRSLKQCYTHSFDLNNFKETVTENKNGAISSVTKEKVVQQEQKFEKTSVSLNKDTHLRQTPSSNTCFLLSLVNALTSSNKGLERLNQVITDQGIVYKNKIFPIFKNRGNYSPLENTLINVYKEFNRTFVPGTPGEALQAAQFIFGLKYNDGIKCAENNQNISWDNIKKNIKDHDVTILHKHGQIGHYIAITDADVRNGEHMIKIKDSLKNTEEWVKFEDTFNKNDTIHHFKL